VFIIAADLSSYTEILQMSEYKKVTQEEDGIWVAKEKFLGKVKSIFKMLISFRQFLTTAKIQIFKMLISFKQFLTTAKIQVQCHYKVLCQNRL